MRVVHVPFGYFPDTVGGTEVYVAELVRGLRARGVHNTVAAPAVRLADERYEHDGIPVRRFAINHSATVAELYGEGDAVAANAIAAVLDDVDADVLHLHAFTAAASLRAARIARRRGIAVVFTYHTPTASCVRGTLLHEGHAPCDGHLDAQRCTACLLESRGVPLPLREALSRAPVALGAAVGSIGASGRWATALRARELVAARHDAFRQLLGEADAIVAVCEWVRVLLLQAGAAPTRLMLSRQGTPPRTPISRRQRRAPGDGLRLAFVGRLDPVKGVHVVLSALRARPDLAVTLDLFGVAQDDAGIRYRDELLALTAGDGRVRFREPFPADRSVDTLAEFDATVVPSQGLETGPLTVLESFAAGVPVIGSNLGGIAELVAHDRDGWLVAHDSERAWSDAISHLIADRGLLDRLRSGVRPPRSTDDVARDMMSVYDAVVPRRTPRTFAAPAAFA